MDIILIVFEIDSILKNIQKFVSLDNFCFLKRHLSVKVCHIARYMLGLSVWFASFFTHY